MFRRSGFLIIFLTGLCLSSAASAATITLTSGEQVTGDILEKTSTYVMVDMQGLPTTYYLGEIQDIDGQSPEVSTSTAAASDQASAPQAPVAAPSSTTAPAAPNYGDEEDSLIRFMNDRAQAAAAPATTAAAPAASAVAPAASVAPAATPAPAAAAATTTAAPATTPTPVAAPATTPAAAVAPAAAAPAAPAPAASDADTLPTLQQFLENFFNALFGHKAAPVSVDSTSTAAATPAAAPAAPAPAATDADTPPTLQQFLQNFFNWLLGKK